MGSEAITMTMLVFLLGTPALLFVVGLAFGYYAITCEPWLSAVNARRPVEEVPQVTALSDRCHDRT